ncbi:antibiotic biosynthesis monooxygenase [Haliea sp. AH-315-K21]|uniref:ABM domain-containing protein n=1 Tax=SAR86 cluster bacterium TaxID=2030880 RepID=A0A2A5CCP6_9GAMM|nr:antibiotic biosynthesis monooxygenase [Haliea sp. AH-315-K21]PCJ41230.1 MAG: hypothetical protein COA71_09340 [SAR86 cluster bacterium]
MHLIKRAKFHFLLVTVGLNLFVSPGVFAEVYYTNELSIVPELAEDFHDFIQEVARDTRAFEGCLHFSILVDENDPARVVFYEIWESKEEHAAYRQWRNDNDFGAEIGPYLAGEFESHYYIKLPE